VAGLPGHTTIGTCDLLARNQDRGAALRGGRSSCGAEELEQGIEYPQRSNAGARPGGRKDAWRRVSDHLHRERQLWRRALRALGPTARDTVVKWIIGTMLTFTAAGGGYLVGHQRNSSAAPVTVTVTTTK
jgi:hypothetical protein